MNYDNLTVESIAQYCAEKSGFKINKADLESQIQHLINIEQAKQLILTDVVERFALIQWINGQPLIDGSDSFNTKEDALKHWQTLPKIDNVIYTVCRIRNVL